MKLINQNIQLITIESVCVSVWPEKENFQNWLSRKKKPFEILDIQFLNTWNMRYTKHGLNWNQNSKSKYSMIVGQMFWRNIPFIKCVLATCYSFDILFMASCALSLSYYCSNCVAETAIVLCTVHIHELLRTTLDTSHFLRWMHEAGLIC